MRLTNELHVEQQQKLVVTPELRQAIAILQMSSLELAEYLQQELESNPVLEVKEEMENNETAVTEDLHEEDMTQLEWWEYFLDRSDLGYTGRVNKDEIEKHFENHVAAVPTLHEHLYFQLHLALTSEESLNIGKFLIGCIDSNGYLTITPEEAAETLKVPLNQVLEVLKVIQTMEPYGVGARDLSECLLIQLTQTGKLTPEIEKIVKNYLSDLGRGRIAKIAATMRMSIIEVQYITDLIRTLDPKPGRKYSSGDDVRYLVPDVIVEKVNDDYLVTVNDANSPHFTINPYYQDLMRQPGIFNRDARKYLEERLNSALWLIKSIEHRRLTLYKTVQCMADIQRDFLDKGVKFLKPLNLKQVARMVGVHESTISRVTANKYVQTPQGVFELKYFFCGGVDAAGSDNAFSSRSIKRMIKEIIMEEDVHKPLSDQEIAAKLKARGIEISRRTVAKYRTDLGIASTSKRRRY